MNTHHPRAAWRTASTCALCGGPFNRSLGTRRSRDHIIPKSWEGPTVAWNSRAVHVDCNSQRGNGELPMDVEHLAANLIGVVSARHSLDDREAMARQLIDAFHKWHTIRTARKRIWKKNRIEVERSAIPPIVRVVLDGGFPWD